MGKIAALVSTILAAVLFAAGALYGNQRAAYKHAKELAAIAQAESDAYKDRTKTDAKIQGLNDYDLCRRVARVPDSCEPLRGLDAPAEGE